MKKLLIILFLFCSSSFASIDPHGYKDKNSTLLKNENDINRTELSPIIVEYIDNLSEELQHDLALLNEYCDNNVTTIYQRNLFKQCFENHKKSLNSAIFRDSTALSLAFVDDVNQRNMIAQQFLNTYKNELIKIGKVADNAKFPREPFYNSLTQMFSNILKNSYLNSKIIIKDQQKLNDAVEEYFIHIAQELDKIHLEEEH